MATGTGAGAFVSDVDVDVAGVVAGGGGGGTLCEGTGVSGLWLGLADDVEGLAGNDGCNGGLDARGGAGADWGL